MLNKWHDMAWYGMIWHDHFCTQPSPLSLHRNHDATLVAPGMRWVLDSEQTTNSGALHIANISQHCQHQTNIKQTMSTSASTSTSNIHQPTNQPQLMSTNGNQHQPASASQRQPASTSTSTSTPTNVNHVNQHQPTDINQQTNKTIHPPNPM